MSQRLWQILSTVNEWVRYSDSKAVALLGIQGVLIGLIVVFIKDIYTSPDFTLASLVCLIAGILFIAVSMVFTFLCLTPRLKSEVGISPIYFGSIAGHFKNSKEYINYLEENFNSEEKVSDALAEQVYSNSRIAKTKFIRISWAIRLFVVGLFFWIVLVIMDLL